MRGDTIHDRVSTAILETAATLLAREGEPPSMAEFAAAAGVGRATLYRYFPTREALFEALARTALESISGLLADADLDGVPVSEALARVARSIVTVGAQYAVLASQPKQLGRGEMERAVGAPIARVMQRGLDDGSLRPDLNVEELLAVFGGLIQAAVRLSSQDSLGVERASALVISVFLHGAAAAPAPA